MAERFPITSRYHRTETAQHQTKSGRTVVYLRRRFVPPPERFESIQAHTVTEGERPDTVAATYLGDPEQFWQLCDANAALHPAELTETVGRTLRITLPEGVAGPIL